MAWMIGIAIWFALALTAWCLMKMSGRDEE